MESTQNTQNTFSKPAKKRASSEARAASYSKRQFINEVYKESNCEVDFPEVSTQKQQAAPIMVDKSIDNSPRIATKSTQYQRQNTPTPPTKKGETLKVKLTKRKSRDAGTNTELSFSPFSLVSFTIDSENSGDEGKLDDERADEEEINDMEKDPNFEPESESQSENEMCEEIVEEGKQYFVFWSCLKTLFRTCSDCFCKAYITKTFFRGSMLCVEFFVRMVI